MEPKFIMPPRPTKGYKAVIRYTQFRWFILEMDIPDDATIVHAGDGFYRTDKVVPRHFWATRFKTAIMDTAARSWFDPEFSYTLGHTAMTELDMNLNNDCVKGIHFFDSFEQAVNWGNANFGREAAI